jgi:hypothetical protein
MKVTETAFRDLANIEKKFGWENRSKSGKRSLTMTLLIVLLFIYFMLLCFKAIFNLVIELRKHPVDHSLVHVLAKALTVQTFCRKFLHYETNFFLNALKFMYVDGKSGTGDINF